MIFVFTIQSNKLVKMDKQSNQQLKILYSVAVMTRDSYFLALEVDNFLLIGWLLQLHDEILFKELLSVDWIVVGTERN